MIDAHTIAFAVGFIIAMPISFLITTAIVNLFWGGDV